MVIYDAIIVGAGPAGLSIGSELSKDFNILVLEKNDNISTNKCWAVLEKLVKKFNLERFVDNNAKISIYRTFDGVEVKRRSAFNITINSNKVLNYWADLITKNKGKIIISCEFKDFERSKDMIDIKTSKGMFRCRLLIDASGSDSRILKRYKLLKEKYFWSVYGYLYRRIRWNKDVLVALETTKRTDPNKKQKLRDFLFYYPRTDKDVWIALWAIYDRPLPADYMRREFNKTLSKSLYYNHVKNGRKVLVSEGAIPLYVLKQAALDNVLLVGDAGGWTPFATGTGFNMILKKYRIISKKIKKALEENKLGSKELEKITTPTFDEENNILLHKLIAFLDMYTDDKKFDDLTSMINIMGERVYDKFVNMNLTTAEIIFNLRKFNKKFDIRYIINTIPPEDIRCLVTDTIDYLSKRLGIK